MSLRAISSPIPREAPVTIAVRPATEFTRLLSGVREPEEFVPCFRIIAENSAQRRCDRLRVLLLHAAHHHAEMEGLDDNSTPSRMQDRANRLSNLVREAFLHLQSPRKDIDDSRKLRQSDNPSVRDIRDVRLSIERQHVLLA